MMHSDGESIVDQPADRRENFVPLHTVDLVEYLAQNATIDEQDEKQFRKIAALILALLHHLYRQRHEQLTYIYAPLDPDCDRMLRSVPTDEKREQLIAELFEQTEDALHRANYHKLGEEDIRQAIDAASQWGVRMRVNFALLQRLDVYARGFVIGKRKYRNWRNWFRLETVDVQLYQRILIVFHTSPELASSQFDSRRVYLRLFKNVPRQDIDMMLPATGIQMSWIDHSKIVVPSLYAVGITLYRFLRNVFLLAFFGVFKTVGLIVLVVFAIGFGIKSMFTYRTNTKRRYLLNMAQSLYYQSLDNNAGVLFRLLEDGEQQEACEAILAYFVTAILPQKSGPLSLQEIDDACEQVLLDATGLRVDFDVENTVHNLMHLGILHADADGWSALPPDQALRKLDATWDNWFNV